MHFVIPGLTRNPVLSWIPAFAGMTRSVANNDAVYIRQYFSGLPWVASCRMDLLETYLQNFLARKVAWVGKAKLGTSCRLRFKSERKEKEYER
jgi:hypothetical protein